MSKYPTHYDSYLRAHFQGIGAATSGAGAGVGVNDPSTLMGQPISPGTPSDGQILKYSSASGAWILGTASVTFANPTAVASDVAVNGSALTAMRSDAAPAIQKASASQFGLVKPDGTIITVSSGVITVPTATNSVLGVVKPDGTIITNTAGAITVPKASSSTFGVCEVDNTTITSAAGVLTAVLPVSANPTGTGSDTATNGSALTWMRSDATFAIQKATSGQFGLVKVDGTTITASSGVISAATSAALDVLGSTQGAIIYRNASAWVVLAPGTAGYLLKTGGASANPSWVSGPVGSSGNTYSMNCIGTQTVKAAAFATYGVPIPPLKTFTIDEVYVPINTTNNHVYSCSILVINGSHVVQSVVATTTTTAVGTAKQIITFSFGALETLTAGVLYMISVTDTSAAAGSTALPMYNGGTPTGFINCPVDQSDTDHIAAYELAKNSAPAASDSFSLATGVVIIQIRAQV